MKGDLRVEQSVYTFAARLEVDAQIRREKQVGLTCLDTDAHRGTAAVEVPGTRHHIVLGDHAAGARYTLGALHRHDAIDQH